MMFLNESDVVAWNSCIPFAAPAIDLTDDADSTRGVNKEVLILNVMEKTASFLDRTGLLQDEIVISGQRDECMYRLYDYEDYRIQKILLVVAGGEPLVRSDLRYNGRKPPFGQFNDLPNHDIIIGNPPCQDDDEYLKIWCTFKLNTFAACGMPKNIFNDYGRAITAGAVADIVEMAQVKQEKTTANQGVVSSLRRLYQDGLTRGIQEAQGLGKSLQVNDRKDLDSYLMSRDRGFF